MSDYYATLRVQNGRLKAAMEREGYATAAAMSRATGVRQYSIWAYLNFRQSPVDSKRCWRNSAVAVAAALNMEPEQLFPDHMQHVAARNTLSAYVAQPALGGYENAPMRMLPATDSDVQDDVAAAVIKGLDGLTERERKVIEARFWEGDDRADVAKKYKVTPARIAQIEAGSLRKMRRPATMKILEEALEACRS